MLFDKVDWDGPLHHFSMLYIQTLFPSEVSDRMSSTHRIANTATTSPEIQNLLQNPCLAISHRFSVAFIFAVLSIPLWCGILFSLSTVYLGWFSNRIFFSCRFAKENNLKGIFFPISTVCTKKPYSDWPSQGDSKRKAGSFTQSLRDCMESADLYSLYHWGRKQQLITITS